MKQNFQFIFSQIKKSNSLDRSLLVLLFLVGVVRLLTSLLPTLMGQAVDLLSGEGNFWQVIFAMGVVIFLLVLLTPFQSTFQTKWIQNVVRQITMSWYETVFQKDFSFFQKNNSARMAQALERGVQAHEKLLQQLIGVLLPVFIEALLVTGLLLFKVGVEVIIFILAMMLVQGYLTLRLIQARRSLISELNDIEDEAAEQVVEMIQRGLVFKLYQAVQIPLQRLATVFSEYAEQCVRIAPSGATLGSLPFYFQNFAMIVALAYGYTKTQNGLLSLGSVLAIIAYTGRFSSAIGDCIGAFRYLDQFQLDAKEAHRLLAGPSSERLGVALLQLRQLQVKAGSLQPHEGEALCVSTDFIFQPGDRVAIIGPSGGGKSTFLKVLAGIDESSRNRIFWNDQSLQKASLNSQLQNIRYCPQDPWLFDGTLAENTFVSAINESPWLEQLKLTVFQNSVRQKLRPQEVSGGEAKRLSLLRSLCVDGQVFLFDEPTAGLHPDLQKQTWNALFEKTKHGVLIAVTHDTEVLHQFNKVIEVKQGQVCAYFR